MIICSCLSLNIERLFAVRKILSGENRSFLLLYSIKVRITRCIYGRLRYLPEMQKFFDEVCETQEEWIRRRYTEIAYEKKQAGGKEFTYGDVKRKVQSRRDSYERNKKLIETLITELNDMLFMSNER